MNGNSISKLDLQNLLIKINKTSSFVEKLHFTLNWTGNDYQKIAFTGVSWFNETSFFIKADQLASLFGVKPETIGASLRHNNFLKQYNPFPNGQKYFWTKPGFSVHSFQLKNQNLSNTTSNTDLSNSNQSSSIEFNSSESDKQSISTSSDLPSTSTLFASTASSTEEPILISGKNDENQQKNQFKSGNKEFDKILNIFFSSSDSLNTNEINEIFYQNFCPNYIERFRVEEVFNDYFSLENCHFQTENPDSELVINREEFWKFYQHFGPLNSILAKYNLYKNYSSQENSKPIIIGDKNIFLVNGIFIYNNMKQNAGELFLKDENGHSYDSWEKIIEAQIIPHEEGDQPPPPTLQKYMLYPILT